MTATERSIARLLISNAVRQATAPPHDLACIGCGRDRRDTTYTAGCATCWERNYKRAKRRQLAA